MHSMFWVFAYICSGCKLATQIAGIITWNVNPWDVRSHSGKIRLSDCSLSHSGKSKKKKISTAQVAPGGNCCQKVRPTSVLRSWLHISAFHGSNFEPRFPVGCELPFDRIDILLTSAQFWHGTFSWLHPHQSHSHKSGSWSSKFLCKPSDVSWEVSDFN